MSTSTGKIPQASSEEQVNLMHSGKAIQAIGPMSKLESHLFIYESGEDVIMGELGVHALEFPKEQFCKELLSRGHTIFENTHEQSVISGVVSLDSRRGKFTGNYMPQVLPNARQLKKSTY
ncbi:hypothetical protein FOL47_010708 [Perkinsus chesapeaki]|uniref:Uncharacterized protein n=1 Tax=Perkinsus chesapeaki TaxID=330153 RepID=A0A7J6L2M3_PERCH|nr:hypothetical protein FOL47_010708 [Perkinsus chesapeaki]